MRLSTITMGLGALGVGAAMQSGGALYDLGEAMAPVETFATGAGKAASAAIDAATKGVELPPWLLLIALIILGVRFVLFSPVADKVVQGRNDRITHAQNMELTRLEHAQQIEKIRLEHGEKP